MASLPHTIWKLYVDNFVYYEPDSWVQRIASTFRILAFLLISPVLILTCLDVASYVIARTLGVIEHTKASTSENDAGEYGDRRAIPAVVLSQDSSHPEPDTLREPQTLLFVQGNVHDMGNLKLSGFDEFSPAPSGPPSPSSSRHDLDIHRNHQQFSSENNDDTEHISQSTMSSSGSESYAMLEQDSGSEKDGGELRLRKRDHPGAAGVSADD